MDARKLHAALGVPTRFTNWFPRRVETYEFVEGVDYAILLPNFGQNSNHRPAVDYVVTLSMARQLSVVEDTPEGKVVRLYVLDCERRIREADLKPETVLQALKNPTVLLALLQQHALEEERLTVENRKLLEHNTELDATVQKMGLFHVTCSCRRTVPSGNA